VIVEATFEGKHTTIVKNLLKCGFMLFILSEVMFFVSLFWALFHFSLNPTVNINYRWPPCGICTVEAFSLPLLNTILLLSSGVSVVCGHRAFLEGDRVLSILSIIYTIVLGGSFTVLQFFEYKYADFSINDSVYGSVFYLITGSHGLHVVIGTLFLVVMLSRQVTYHFTLEHYSGIEVGIWYWHFVGRLVNAT
jgi:cytochrome c oxidase subunit 3